MLKSPSFAIAALLCSVAGGLAGCSDPKAPSKNAFRTALEPVVQDRFCSPLDVRSLEVEGQGGAGVFPIITSPTRTMFGPGADGRSVAMLDAAAALGFVSRTTFEKPARSLGSDDEFVRQPLISYGPTEKGAGYLRAVEVKATNKMVTVPMFCVAKGEVVDVVRWSEPVDLGGRRMSQVTYSYRGINVSPAIPEAEKAKMATPREATMPFELQSDGWRPMSR